MVPMAITQESSSDWKHRRHLKVGKLQ